MPVLFHLASFLHTTATTVATTSSKSSSSILDPIAKPIAWALAEIYSVVPNYGVAIMLLSVFWMILISPLTLKSTRSMLAMQKLQPQLKALQEKHKNDRQAFAQAQMELFKEHQVSPFGACLPMLLPMPVFIALFRVIDGLSHTVKGPDPSLNCTLTTCVDPKWLSHSSKMFHSIVAAHGHIVAFGMDLSKNAFSHHNGFLAALPFWLALLVMGATSYFQSAMMMSRNQAAQNNPQMRMMKYIPLLFVVICARFPAGVIIYYAMSNICRIVQQDAMYRFDPRVKALVAMEVAEVEELTQEIDEQAKNKGGGNRNRPSAGPDPKALNPAKGTPAKGTPAKGTPAKGTPAKGTPAKGTPAKGTPAKGGGAAGGGGRSRFRDLLQAAQEQQTKSPPNKSNGGGTNGNGTNGKGGTNGSAGGSTSTNGNGARDATPPNGSGNSNRNGSGKGQSRPGGRTNRKRRGK